MFACKCNGYQPFNNLLITHCDDLIMRRRQKDILVFTHLYRKKLYEMIIQKWLITCDIKYFMICDGIWFLYNLYFLFPRRDSVLKSSQLVRYDLYSVLREISHIFLIII